MGTSISITILVLYISQQKVQFLFQEKKLKTSKRLLFLINVLLVYQISHFLLTKILLKHIFA